MQVNLVIGNEGVLYTPKNWNLTIIQFSVIPRTPLSEQVEKNLSPLQEVQYSKLSIHPHPPFWKDKLLDEI